MTDRPLRIDALQYALWSETVFDQMRAGGVDCVHVTIAYHETFREAVRNVEAWNRLFERHSDRIAPAGTGDEVRAVAASGRTAIVFGFQNPSPIEDDIGLVEVWHRLGVRFMQLTYNNQSLLGTGWCEDEDTGLTRMGREVVKEMNRVGMAIDMSHAGTRTTLDAVAASDRPVAVTHANPRSWHATGRNVTDDVLRALAESGGMFGFSCYPHHLDGGSDCSLASFCAMMARTAEITGPERLGIGSDLCQDRPPETLVWMRNGRWTKPADDAAPAAFPKQPAWFRDNRDFAGLADGLRRVGFSDSETDGILGGNWLDFFDRSFIAAAS